MAKRVQRHEAATSALEPPILAAEPPARGRVPPDLPAAAGLPLPPRTAAPELPKTFPMIDAPVPAPERAKPG